jgi:hypothetical protein
MKANLLLYALDRALQTGVASKRELAKLHDTLLAEVRRPSAAIPNWDAYPKGRDYFLQS